MFSLAAVFLLAALRAAAIDISITGDYEPGQTLQFQWTGVPPWTMEILVASDGNSPFGVYRSFPDITVASGTWTVDVPVGTFVEFELNDATGDSTAQIIQVQAPAIDDPLATLSLSSVMSESSVSTVSELSTESILSDLSTASLASLTSTTTTTTTTTPADIASTTPAPSVVLVTPSLPESTVFATASPSTTALPSTSTSSGKSGKVAGAVIGVILGLLLLGACLFVYHRKRHLRRIHGLEESITPYVGPDDDEKVHSNLPPNPPQQPITSANGGYFHSRTLSRTHPPGARDTVNWAPDEPHFTPNEAPLTNTLQLHSPSPVSTRPSVLDLARNGPSYTTTSQRLSSNLDPAPATGSASPFADKFAVRGQYVPETHTADVNLAVSGVPLSPPPPRPRRGPSLDLDTQTQEMATGVVYPNQGPTPTVGHTRKISAPIPMGVYTSAMSPNQHSDAYGGIVDLPPVAVGHSRKISAPMPRIQPLVQPRESTISEQVPQWALSSEGSRYPTIGMATNNVPNFAGRGAGVGTLFEPTSPTGDRPIYPAVAMSPAGAALARQASLRQQAARSPPPAPSQLTRSPPPVGARSPPAVAKRLVTPPSGRRTSFGSMTKPPPMLALPPTPEFLRPDVPITPDLSLSDFPTPPGSQRQTDSPSPSESGRTDSPSSGEKRAGPPPPITTSIPYMSSQLSPVVASPVSMTGMSPLASSMMSPAGLTNNPSTIPYTPNTPYMLHPTNYDVAPSVPRQPTKDSLSPNSFVSPHESWTGGAGGKHISMAPTEDSGRRLSEIGPADAEWRELQARLAWSDGAHVMPPMKEE